MQCTLYIKIVDGKVTDHDKLIIDSEFNKQEKNTWWHIKTGQFRYWRWYCWLYKNTNLDKKNKKSSFKLYIMKKKLISTKEAKKIRKMNIILLLIKVILTIMDQNIPWFFIYYLI